MFCFSGDLQCLSEPHLESVKHQSGVGTETMGFTRSKVAGLQTRWFLTPHCPITLHSDLPQLDLHECKNCLVPQCLHFSPRAVSLKTISALPSRMGLFGSKNQLMSNEKHTSGGNPKTRGKPPPAPPKVSLQLCVLLGSPHSSVGVWSDAGII